MGRFKDLAYFYCLSPWQKYKNAVILRGFVTQPVMSIASRIQSSPVPVRHLGCGVGYIYLCGFSTKTRYQMPNPPPRKGTLGSPPTRCREMRWRRLTFSVWLHFPGYVTEWILSDLNLLSCKLLVLLWSLFALCVMSLITNSRHSIRNHICRVSPLSPPRLLRSTNLLFTYTAYFTLTVLSCITMAEPKQIRLSRCFRRRLTHLQGRLRPDRLGRHGPESDLEHG
jgi:hypothetical protein